MKHTYCTYFDRNYLFRGLVLIESLRRHESVPFTMYVVCMDELTKIVLDGLMIEQVVTVSIDELERGDDPLSAAKANRSAVEYLWTCTPTIILRLLERNPEVQVLTYLDSDMCFFSSPDPIFEQLGDRSVLIHPHNFPYPKREEVKWGIYNVGMLTFRSDERGLGVLRWWRERCIEWCYARLEDGKYGDQRYLDRWPEQFEGVAVSAHDGIGVAPWNHANFLFSKGSAGEVRVDSVPLVFYHFHSLKIVNSDCVIPFGFDAYPVTEEILRLCVVPYAEELGDAMARVWSAHPDFRHGFFATQTLDPALVIVASPQVCDAIRTQAPSYRRTDLSSRWACAHAAPFRDQQQLALESRPPHPRESYPPSGSHPSPDNR